MTSYMLIAPDSPQWDRKWFDHGRNYCMRFIDPPDTSVQWPSAEAIEPRDFYGRERSATLRSLVAPGWKVPLAFMVDDRLGLNPDIPRGYVMPGWLWGVPKEQSHLCEVCRRHADTPARRRCFDHLMEYMRSIGL